MSEPDRIMILLQAARLCQVSEESQKRVLYGLALEQIFTEIQYHLSDYTLANEMQVVVDKLAGNQENE